MIALRRLAAANARFVCATPITRPAVARTCVEHPRWLASKAFRKLKPSPSSSTTSKSRVEAQQQPSIVGQEPSERPQEQEPKPNPPKDNIRSGRRATYRDVLYGLAITVQFFLIGHFVSSKFYALTLPYGASMLPTIYVSGEMLLINKHYRYGRDVHVGDVICALHPLFPDGHAVIKRVIGMPGDFIWVVDPEGGPGEGRMIQVPKGHCWIAGDNHGHSRDSRYYGAVPLGLVTGKVSWRVSPFRSWGRIENTLEEADEIDFAI